MLPVRQEKCNPPAHQIPDIYEETDSFVSTGQGEIQSALNAFAYIF